MALSTEQGGMFSGGIGGMLSGLFTDAGAPYDAAMDQYDKYYGKAEEAQNPFYNAGKQGISGYQNWANSMQNPSSYMNNLMSQYQESPWAKYQQDQSMRTAQNMGSATGLTGSSPLMLQAQQNAKNISSEDMSSWIQNVLGLNTQYGTAQGNLMGMGANSANSLTNMYSKYADSAGDAAYGKEAGENQDASNMLGGAAELAALFFML